MSNGLRNGLSLLLVVAIRELLPEGTWLKELFFYTVIVGEFICVGSLIKMALPKKA